MIRYNIIMVIALLMALEGYSQIQLEHVYPNGSQKLYMVDLELSGMKYVEKSMEPGNRYLKFYNLDHTLWKTIDVNPFPKTQICSSTDFQYNYDALYISETLFNCEGRIEFLYSSYSGCGWYTGVYGENGVAWLDADSCLPHVYLNIPQQYRPLYHTPVGTKLILSHKVGHALVYDVGCQITVGASELNEKEDFKVYPNPSFSETTVAYSLPDGVEKGEIVITNIAGQQVRRYVVNGSTSAIIIPKGDLRAGTYFYSLMNGNELLATEKIVLLD